MGEDYPDKGFVLASTVGIATHPRNLKTVFHANIENAGVPRACLPDLRHTAASLMLGKGVKPTTVSETLGHTNVDFTLQVFTLRYDEQRLEEALNLQALDSTSKDEND